MVRFSALDSFWFVAVIDGDDVLVAEIDEGLKGLAVPLVEDDARGRSFIHEEDVGNVSLGVLDS